MLSESLLSQHPMGIHNITGVNGALYGACWCDPPGGIYKAFAYFPQVYTTEKH